MGSIDVFNLVQISDVILLRPDNEVIVYRLMMYAKENWIEGVGERVSVHFAVKFLDCWRTSFCVTTIAKIANNNTNDKQTSDASLALDEDSPYTNSCLFTLDAFAIVVTQKLVLQQSKYFTAKCTETLSPTPSIQFSLMYANPLLIVQAMYSTSNGQTVYYSTGGWFLKIFILENLFSIF